MTIKSTIWCDECGTALPSTEAARKHEEKNCMPWEIDNRVLFDYQLGSFPGTVTRLGPLVEKPGEERVVYVKSDEQIEEPEDQFHTGHDFFIVLSALQRLEEDEPVLSPNG